MVQLEARNLKKKRENVLKVMLKVPFQSQKSAMVVKYSCSKQGFNILERTYKQYTKWKAVSNQRGFNDTG